MSDDQMDLFKLPEKKHGGKRPSYTLEERKVIQKLLKQGFSGTNIAKHLHRSQNGVNYEIRRNGGRNKYDAEKAHEIIIKRRMESNEKRRNANLGKSGPGLNKRVQNLEMQVEVLFETIKEMRGRNAKNN